MEKYILNLVADSKVNTAMYKAKNDVADVLETEGYNKINYTLYKSSKVKRIISIIKMYKKCSRIKSGIIIYQYPLGPNIDKLLINKFSKNKNIKLIGFIHDINSLQFGLDADDELENIKKFEGIIAHNSKMKLWLERQNVQCPIVTLNVFDYLSNTHINAKPSKNNIVFAGNLKKAGFLGKINSNIIFDVYGPEPLNEYPKCINYLGMLPPSKLCENISEKFGLIWDGNSIDSCDGIQGEYEKYNSPHKFSLYLSTGTPVIAWKDAAVSKFIKENKVGVVVSSLTNIDKILSHVTEKDYFEMKENAELIGRKIKNGYYTKNAVKKILNLV